MDDLLSQRWTERRESWVTPALPFQPFRFEVAPLDEAGARAFVQAHHYSGTYPAARFRFGLYEGHDLVGAAVFSVPVNDKALSMFPGEAVESVELGRLVLLDRVPANAESWFIARAFEGLRREQLRGVLSFSDPMPRHASDGTVLTPGHVGIVYQATNARYLGRATARTLHFLRDGRVFSARAMQKIRAGERGWRAAAEVLRRGRRPGALRGRGPHRVAPPGARHRRHHPPAPWQPPVRVGPRPPDHEAPPLFPAVPLPRRRPRRAEVRPARPRRLTLTPEPYDHGDRSPRPLEP